MAKKYGDPLIAVRLPSATITGIRTLAQQQGTTISAIVRDLIEGRLKENHIDTTPSQIEGQLDIEDV